MSHRSAAHGFTVIDEHGQVLAEIPPVPSDIEERSVEFTCSSGEHYDGTWRGFPIANLFEETAEDDVTHLVFVAVDGYRVCLPVTSVLDAIVATERVDATPEGLPRLIGPSISGTRTIKDIHLVQLKRLGPEEDPSRYESLQ